MNFLLGAAVVPGRLADVEQPGAVADQIEHLVGNETVVEDEVGVLDGPHGLEREEVRVPGPGPHQRHPPGPAGGAGPFQPFAPGRLERLQEPPQLRELQRDLVVPAAGSRGGGGGGGGKGGVLGGVGPGVAAVPGGGGGLGEW